jgi:hypothetical protein
MFILSLSLLHISKFSVSYLLLCFFLNSLSQVPAGAVAFFLNLSSLVGAEARVTDGAHDRDNVIRTATISQKDKIMTMTLFVHSSNNNSSRGRAEVSVEWEENSTKHNKSFGVVVGGEAPATTTTASSSVASFTTSPEVTAPETGRSATAAATHLSRELLWKQEQEQEQEEGEQEQDNNEVHPMGVGERVGTSKYPWQQQALASRRLLDV